MLPQVITLLLLLFFLQVITLLLLLFFLFIGFFAFLFIHFIFDCAGSSLLLRLFSS